MKFSTLLATAALITTGSLAMPSAIEGSEFDLEARQTSEKICGSRSRAVRFARYGLIPRVGIDHAYFFDNFADGILLSGYSPEGVAGYIFPNKEPGTVPFYRLYNAQITDHFYTTSASERDSAIEDRGYKSEGIAGYIYPDSSCGGVPFYRLYSSSATDHFYTTSASERRSAIADGYTSEGIAGWVYRS